MIEPPARAKHPNSVDAAAAPELSQEGTVARLLDRAALEVFPTKGIEGRARSLPQGRRITVTCSPTRGLESTLALSERFQHLGYDVVPHISARLVEDRAHLRAVMTRLALCGIANIFVIGGDVATPAGEFSSSFDLLSALAATGHEFAEVGVAAYPDGHPFLAAEELQRLLLAKQPLATYMVTQMCFDPVTIAGWAVGVRRQGIRLPLHIGLPGVIKRERLLRFALRIGVANSTRFATSHTDLVSKLLGERTYSPETLMTELVSVAQQRNIDIAGLHFYTFNEVEATENLRRSHSSGN